MKYCDICGAEISDEAMMCTSCGYELDKVESCEKSSIETKEEKRNFCQNVMLILLIVFIFCGIIILPSFLISNVGLSNKEFLNILESSGYSEENNIKIVKSERLTTNITGLDANNSNYFVLSLKNRNGKQIYNLQTVNTETKKYLDFLLDYKPLQILFLHIANNENEEINLKLFDKIVKDIKSKGYNYLTDTNNSERFLKEITNKNILSIQKVKEIIENNLSYIFPNISNAKKTKVFYEDGTANPTFFAASTYQQVYQWSSFLPESNYKMMQSDYSLRSSLKTMEYMYGPPYRMGEIWAVVDKNLNQVGTYSTEKEMTDNLLNYKKSSKNVSQEEVHKKRELLKIGTNSDFPPFEYIENGELTGVDIDIAIAIANKLNVKYEFVNTDFDKLIDGVANKSFDIAIAGMTETGLRKDKVDFTNTYYKDFAIAINKEDNILKEDINAAIDELINSGEIDKIVNKYDNVLETYHSVT